MKWLILFFIQVFCLCNSALLLSQGGMWTWIKGADTAKPVANFGIQGVEAPTNTPPGLYLPCAWTDTSGNFWLFGGEDNAGVIWGDLWKLNPATNNWTWVKGSGEGGGDRGIWNSGRAFSCQYTSSGMECSFVG